MLSSLNQAMRATTKNENVVTLRKYKEKVKLIPQTFQFHSIYKINKLKICVFALKKKKDSLDIINVPKRFT